MTCARLILRNISRVSRDGVTEELAFKPGVNLIVGAPNSGKSTWIKLLDHLLGDTDPIEQSLSDDVVRGYTSASAVFTIDGAETTLERQWAKRRGSGEILVNGVAVHATEFSNVWLKLLRMPILHVPAGNPYSGRTWPRLSWRQIYRHIYRNEKSWASIADKQPAAEQHAALMLLLGVADRLFPPSFEQLVDTRRERERLIARKEQYVATLQEITRELLSMRETTVALTPESLTAARERLQTEINANVATRTRLLENLRHATDAAITAENLARQERVATITKQLATLQISREEIDRRLASTTERRLELADHRRAVVNDLAKLERLQAAQTVLADLRITHCPNCDQQVERSAPVGHCFLCSQQYNGGSDASAAGQQRLAFEVQQLQAEAEELDDLLREIDRARDDEERGRRDLEDSIASLDAQLRPTRTAAAWLVPPEIPILDEQRGRLEEQLRQVGRIEQLLARRDELTSEIDRLGAQADTLEADYKQQRGTVKRATTEELLSDAMNDYLNALNAGPVRRWHGGEAGVAIHDREVRLTIGAKRWDANLGGTFRCYFLAAYQYALLRLTGVEGACYPGFAIMDLPPYLGDRHRLNGDEERYLVEPFVELLGRQEMTGTQCILTGHAYDGLENVHRIDLTTIYGPGDTITVPNSEPLPGITQDGSAVLATDPESALDE